jgi:tRNA modification GTPase
MAMDQMRGGISKKIGGLRQQLLDFASLIELELDFSEEDVEFADRGQLKELLLTILKLVEELMASFKMGNVLKKGINTVIAGRPNAGKSTLLNALLEEERAIVSPIAGTTRDTIEEVLQIEGIPFRIIDTAGIREAEDAIEQIGVERTMEKVRQSAVVIYVFDVIDTQPELVREDIKALQQEGIPMLVVANKMDLNPYTLPEHYLGPEEKGVVWVALSALNGMNIGHLKEELVAQVTSGKGIMDTTLLSNARHLEALLSTRESLTAALRIMEEGISSDFMAIEIRHALNHLGEITGEVSTEDLLGNIFSNFCIGK